MAHMIENNQIAYAGEKPWHGLGYEVPRGTSGIEMLKKASLDWRVDLREIGVKTLAGGFDAKFTDNWRAIVRADTGEMFAPVTKWYQPIQNEEVVDFFREYCEAGKAQMETVGALRNGRVIWALAKLNGGDDDIQGVDPVKSYMLFTTSHDSTLATTGKPTQVRVVCNNTITMALHRKAFEESTFRMTHNTKFTAERKDQARQVMGMALGQMQEFNALSQQLAKVTIDEKGWLDFMAKLMGGESHVINEKAELTKTAEAIQTATVTGPGADLPSAKGTLWGAVNGVTYYADHVRGNSKTQQHQRLVAAWFGAGNQIKQHAIKVAVEMAGLEPQALATV